MTAKPHIFDPPTIAQRDAVEAMPDGPARILLVDDDPISRKSLARRLARLGHVVFEAVDGRAGVETARRESPDLVIVDWMMPEMDGPTLCETIRADPKHCSMQLILMTAHDQPKQIAEGLARGADDFLSKAASSQEIMARVQAGLRTHALVRELEHARDSLGKSYQLLANQQEKLDSELRSAARFVTSLLPPMGSWAPGVQVAWQYLPSLALGGDLFNVTAWGTQDLGVYILDASGHGVAAALRAASMMTFLRADSLVRQVGSYDPGAIVTEMNRRFPLSSDGDYFTLWVGTFNLTTRELRFCTAGHSGAIMIGSEGAPVPLTQPTFPIGFQSDTIYTSRAVTLNPGDRVFLCSDGLFEARSPVGEMWGWERLEAMLQSVGNVPLNDALQETVASARQWQQAENFSDDAALVGLEVAG